MNFAGSDLRCYGQLRAVVGNGRASASLRGRKHDESCPACERFETEPDRFAPSDDLGFRIGKPSGFATAADAEVGPRSELAQADHPPVGRRVVV
jgi:hypothetical protein